MKQKPHNKKKKNNNVGSLKYKIVLKIGAFIIGSFFLFFITYIIDTHIYKNKINRNIYFQEQFVAGLNRDQFIETISQPRSEYKKELSLVVSGKNILWEPPVDVVDLMYQASWENVYDVGREGSLFQNIKSWLVRFFRSKELDFQDAQYQMVDEYLVDRWEREIGLEEVFEGSLFFHQGEAVISPPRAGSGIDVADLEKKIQHILVSGSSQSKDIPVKIVKTYPKRSIGDLEDFVHDIEETLVLGLNVRHTTHTDVSTYISPDILQRLLSIRSDLPDVVAVEFDDALLVEVLDDLQVKDARIVLDKNNQVVVESSHPGVNIDIDLLKTEISRYIISGKKTGDIIFSGGVYSRPSFTTKDAEKFELNHLVSEFTTYHGCCGARVENIQLIADMIDGTILNPGERLNVNEILGERTVEKGFKPAGSILKGELVDSIGGGISQFITTLHNAVYWGGYEIIDSKPHSIYFSRYPKAIEATINWPYVDYIFRNDTKGAIMIDTEYTDTSITVRIFGSNHGRILIGKHQSRVTSVDIQNNHPDARKVISSVSPSYNFRDPIVEYISDETLPRGQQVIMQQGGKGYSLDLLRRVLEGGIEIHRDESVVHYVSAKNTIIHVHPCDNPSVYSATCYEQ